MRGAGMEISRPGVFAFLSWELSLFLRETVTFPLKRLLPLKFFLEELCLLGELRGAEREELGGYCLQFKDERLRGECVQGRGSTL